MTQLHSNQQSEQHQHQQQQQQQQQSTAVTMDCQNTIERSECCDETDAVSEAHTESMQSAQATLLATPEGSLKSETDSNRSRRSVQFGSVHVHVHPIVMGLQPATPVIGAPIQLGWKRSEAYSVTVDDYESTHRSNHATVFKDLRISSSIRESWLKFAGYSRTQIEYVKQMGSSNGIGASCRALNDSMMEDIFRRKRRAVPKQKKAEKTKMAAAGASSKARSKSPFLRVIAAPLECASQDSARKPRACPELARMTDNQAPVLASCSGGTDWPVFD